MSSVFPPIGSSTARTRIGSAVRRPPRGAGGGGYWRLSRAPRYSVLFALPLLVLYELLAAVLTPATGGVRNGADVWIRSVVAALAGGWGPLVFGMLLLGGGAYVVARDARRHGWRLQPRIFAGMLAESALLALLFGGVVATATAALLDTMTLSLPPLTTQSGAEVAQGGQGVRGFGGATWVMLSLGAGLYEELMFRVLIVSGLGWLLVRGFGWRPAPAVAVAIVTSAVVFAAAHYVGSLGDAWAIESFTFRLIAGLALSGLYAARGFGIAAWTHALYDLWVGLA